MSHGSLSVSPHMYILKLREGFYINYIDFLGLPKTGPRARIWQIEIKTVTASIEQVSRVSALAIQLD